MNDISVEHKILTVFELHIVEIVNELFKQIRTVAPVTYFENPSTTKEQTIARDGVKKANFARLTPER